MFVSPSSQISGSKKNLEIWNNKNKKEFGTIWRVIQTLFESSRRKIR